MHKHYGQCCVMKRMSIHKTKIDTFHFFLSGNDKNIIIFTHVIHFLFRVIDEFAVLSEYENLFNKGGKIHWF